MLDFESDADALMQPSDSVLNFNIRLASLRRVICIRLFLTTKTMASVRRNK